MSKIYDINGNTLSEWGNGIFFGKTAAFFGDSLTERNFQYSKGYHAWVKEILGLASYENYGVGGYTTEDVYTKIKNTTTTADIIFVMCGVNDQTSRVPLGQFGDTTTGTTYGNVYKICEELKSKFLTQPTIFITPAYQTRYPEDTGTNGSWGVTSYEITKAIKETCENFAIPIYDNFVFSQLYPTNLSIWTNDNCHWNDKMHEKVGKNLAQWVSDNVRYLYV